MQTHPPVRVGFELATDGFQSYVFCHTAKTSLTRAKHYYHPAPEDYAAIIRSKPCKYNTTQRPNQCSEVVTCRFMLHCCKFACVSCIGQ